MAASRATRRASRRSMSCWRRCTRARRSSMYAVHARARSWSTSSSSRGGAAAEVRRRCSGGAVSLAPSALLLLRGVRSLRWAREGASVSPNDCRLVVGVRVRRLPCGGTSPSLSSEAISDDPTRPFFLLELFISLFLSFTSTPNASITLFSFCEKRKRNATTFPFSFSD